MRILHCINVPWYNAVSWYGVSTAAIQQRLGHEVHVAGDPGSPSLEQARQAGISHCHVLPLSSPNPLSQLFTMRRLRRLVETRGIEVVNAHQGNGYFFLARAVRQARHMPLLVRTRGDIRWPQNNVFNRMLYARWSHGIIATAKVTHHRMTATFPIKPDAIEIISPAVDGKHFSPMVEQRKKLRQQLGLPAEEFVFGMVGRIDKKKGHALVLRALGRLLSRGLQAGLVVAGKEQDVTYEELKREAASLKVASAVRWLGYVDDVREVMGACDGGIIPSVDSEAICRVGLEFMAMGVPIIASRLNGIPDIVDVDKTGLLFETGNVDELTEKMEQILKDPKACRNMGVSARAAILERFTLERLGQQSVDFYDRLINKGK